MIASFADRATEDLYHGRSSRHARSFPADVVPAALRKLDVLNSAWALSDMRSPPGNRLEALRGKLAGHYSIRVNDQWRIVFRWDAADPSDVRIVDYHRG